MKIALTSVWLMCAVSSTSSFATTSSHKNNPFVSRGGAPAPAFGIRGGEKGTSLNASVEKEATASSPVSSGNLELLSLRGRTALENLIAFDEKSGAQAHVYGDWPEPGVDDEGKKNLAEQVCLSMSEIKHYCRLYLVFLVASRPH